MKNPKRISHLGLFALALCLAMAAGAAWATMSVYDKSGNLVGTVAIDSSNLGRIEFGSSGGGGGGDVQWGVANGLCCKSGAALTFAVTLDGQTKQSTSNGCGGNASWEGYASCSSGTKSLTYTLSGCANAKGSGSASLSAGKCYAFVTTLEGSSIKIKYGEVTDCGSPFQMSSSSYGELTEVKTLAAFEISGDELDVLGCCLQD